MPPLHVALIWHMHQPYYRQPNSNMALLPWVRLHATKDYLHMAQVVEHYPDVHVTFTLVPSLAEQIRDYAAGNLQDRVMVLALQPYFSPDDKHYLLNMCFSIDWDNIIRRYPRYEAILNRRHLALLNPDYFSEQTYRDLIVWFNLAWTDPNLLEQDELLRSLVQKGQHYSIADAEQLISRQLEIVGDIMPAFRRMQDSGQLEIITVPYYHPILPLLIDSDIAQRPSPGLPVPTPPFKAADDARIQIAQAVALQTELLGRRPRGMWPSEGAVSPEMLPMAAAQGIRWLATDEAVLGSSLDVYFKRDATDLVEQADLLYQPYLLQSEQGDLAIVFRDHDLSDRVGFTYQYLGGEQAAEDMIVRLKRIHHRMRQQEAPALVSIILDGENAWEHYQHNGDLFLHALYRRLQQDPDLKAVTVHEHLRTYPPKQVLPELASGSWIRGDYTTWIGDPEHNEAWRRLVQLRECYERWLAGDPEDEHIADAQRYLFAAEGSDWFWWYSHHNSSDQDALYDQTFIDYLIAAYRAMDIEPPEDIFAPIQGLSERAERMAVAISPRLNADPDANAQWSRARLLRPVASAGAMQQAGGVIRVVRYGNDANYLYLRLELMSPLEQHHVEIGLQTDEREFLLSRGRDQVTTYLYQLMDGSHISLGPANCAVQGSLMEISAPFSRLGLSPLTPGMTTTLSVGIDSNEASGERLPAKGNFMIDLVTDARS